MSVAASNEAKGGLKSQLERYAFHSYLRDGNGSYEQFSSKRQAMSSLNVETSSFLLVEKPFLPTMDRASTRKNIRMPDDLIRTQP